MSPAASERSSSRHWNGNPGRTAPVASNAAIWPRDATATSRPGRLGTRSATTGDDQIRPGSVARHATVLSACHTIRSSSRGATISIVPSPSRSATAGDPSHASCQRSDSVYASRGAATAGAPVDAAEHDGGGSGPGPSSSIPGSWPQPEDTAHTSTTVMRAFITTHDNADRRTGTRYFVRFGHVKRTSTPCLGRGTNHA